MDGLAPSRFHLQSHVYGHSLSRMDQIQWGIGILFKGF
jgi:hypothetical protein